MWPLPVYTPRVVAGSVYSGESTTASPASTTFTWLQPFVFLLCGIGNNICFATYLAYIKVYGELDGSMLGYMMISVLLAASFVVVFRGILDTWGPSLMTPKTKYTMSISISILTMTATLAVLPFNRSITAILIFGMLIGLFEGSGTMYSLALASCYSGEATKYVNTGQVIAMMIPVGLSLALGFYKENATRAAEILFAAIPAVLCFLCFVLYLGVVATRGFDSAFERMERVDRMNANSRNNRTAKDEENLPLIKEGKPEATRNAEENEGWFGPTLGICIPVMCATNILTPGFVPLMQVVADLSYAHILMLTRFFAESVGRLCSHFVGEYFGAKTVLLLTIARLILAIALVFETFNLRDLNKSNRLKAVYAVQVFFFYLMGNYTKSETMAIAINARPNDTRLVAYVMLLLTYIPNVVSLIVVVFLLQYYGVA
jgi:hypothetical protein